MHFARPLAFGLAAALTLFAYPAFMGTDQPLTVARASPSTPSSLTDQQTEDIVQRSHPRLVGERLQYIWCNWLPRPPHLGALLPATPIAPGTPNTGTTSGPTAPNGPAPPRPAPSQSGYAVWAEYVASHIESGTTFGADYPQIAAQALDPTGITDSSMSWCHCGATTSTSELQAISAADPAQIGRTLFDAFAPYDPDTRKRLGSKPVTGPQEAGASMRSTLEEL